MAHDHDHDHELDAPIDTGPAMRPWLPLGALAVLGLLVFGGMTLDGRGGPVAAFLLMILMLAGWCAAFVAVSVMFYCLIKGKIGPALLMLALFILFAVVTLLLVMPALKLASGQ